MAGAEIPVEDLLDRPWTGYSEETLDLLNVFFPPIADQLIRRLLEASPARREYDAKKTIDEAMKTGIAYPQYTRRPRKQARAKLVVVIRFSGASGLSLGPILRVVEILRKLADFEVYAVSTVVTPATLRPDIFSIEEAWRHYPVPSTPLIDGYRMVSEIHSDAAAKGKHLIVVDALESFIEATPQWYHDSWNREQRVSGAARRVLHGDIDRYRQLRDADPAVARWEAGFGWNWKGRYGGVANPLAFFLWFAWSFGGDPYPEGPPSKGQRDLLPSALSLVDTYDDPRELYDAAGLPPGPDPIPDDFKPDPKPRDAIFAGLVARLAAKYSSVHWVTPITDHFRKLLETEGDTPRRPYVDSHWWRGELGRGEFKFPGWGTRGVYRYRAATLTQLLATFEQIMRGI